MRIARSLGLGLLALFAAVTVAGTPVLAQQQTPNILFIMGDDIGWMQPSIYHRSRQFLGRSSPAKDDDSERQQLAAAHFLFL